MFIDLLIIWDHRILCYQDSFILLMCFIHCSELFPSPYQGQGGPWYPLNDRHSTKQKVLSTFFFVRNLIHVLNLNRSCVLWLQSKMSSWTVSGGMSESQGPFSSTGCDRYIRGARVCSCVTWNYVKCLLSSRFPSTTKKRVIQQHQSYSLVHLYQRFHIVKGEHLCGVADLQKQQAFKV